MLYVTVHSMGLIFPPSIDSQDNPHSSPLQTQLTDATGITTGRTSSTLETQLASITPTTTANTRTTRSAVNTTKQPKTKEGI